MGKSITRASPSPSPSEEYREPTEAEWEEFEKHFRHRKMALGDCYRPYRTDCPYEHACVRCPMLRMDPEQLVGAENRITPMSR